MSEDPTWGLREGDTVAATIQNNAERDVYVAILDLSSDGTMSLVNPAEQGAKEVLKPGFNVLEIVRHIRPIGTDGSDRHSEGFREL